MAAHTPLYSLLPVRISAAQRNMDSLVTVLCCRIFPGWCWGLNHRLERDFSRMLHRPQLAALQLGPFYVDRVTSGPPSMSYRWELPNTPTFFSVLPGKGAIVCFLTILQHFNENYHHTRDFEGNIA